MSRRRPSRIVEWAEPFDPAAELDWSDPTFSRRLLREHLDQAHDSASRRLSVVAGHVTRLGRLLPAAPATVLDAGCGPGLYAARLARLGYEVTGVDVSPASLRHAREEARRLRVESHTRFVQQDLRRLRTGDTFDAAILIYYVLEAFPRTDQARVLRRVASCVRPGGTVIVELRLRPDQLPGRTTWWDVVDRSLLSDRRHLLLSDAVYEPRRHTFVLRETAVFDDGSTATQQTSGWLCPWERIPSLFERAGLRVVHHYDGWSRRAASALSESVLVVARPVR